MRVIMLKTALETLEQYSQSTALVEYERTRRRENAKMMRMMDAIQFGWRNSNPIMQLATSASLKVAGVPWVKRWLLQQAVGK